MAFKLTKNQCTLLVGALTLFIVYLWGCRCMGKKPVVGASLVSSEEAQQVVYIAPDPSNQLANMSHPPPWGWDTIRTDAGVFKGLKIIKYKDPVWSQDARGDPVEIQLGQGYTGDLELTLSKSGVSAKLFGDHLGLLYRSSSGEVRTERYRAVGDKPLQLTSQKLQKRGNYDDIRGYYTLKDPGSELRLGFTDQYARQDGPAPLVMGSLSDSNFAPFVVYLPNPPQL